MEKRRLDEAEELLGSASINLESLVNIVPDMAKHPFYRIAKYQLDEGLRALRGEASVPIELTPKEQMKFLGRAG